MDTSSGHFARDLKLVAFVVCAVVCAAVLAWLLGAGGGFRSGTELKVDYAFAGGVETGAPVRVAGVRVGKVAGIELLSPEAVADMPPPRPAVRLTLQIDRKALPLVREDSRFYVNIAGIIGERYLEVSPGSSEAKPLAAKSVVRGIDPPRIDQLLSQGYGVFGKVLDFLDRNEKTFQEFFVDAEGLLKQLHDTLRGSDKRKLFELIDNVNGAAAEMRALAKKAHDPEGRKFFSQLAELLERAHQIDKPTVKKFFQEEGIRTRIF